MTIQDEKMFSKMSIGNKNVGGIKHTDCRYRKNINGELEKKYKK